MRLREKTKLLNILNSIDVIQKEIIDIADSDRRRELITNCQDYAIKVGEFIERLEYEGHPTVKTIEEYCEVLFEVYSGDTEVSCLQSALCKVKASLEVDVTAKKEVAFLPYKASMWDSLESIYLKLRENPDVDAYVVPIPYQDVDADGNTQQMHLEADQYPNGIEITDWTEYDIEERKPDVIYIHNPYDEYNKVTRVHPRFFASNLAKLTDELIYVPYFVLPEIAPDNRIAIEAMKHFCYLPGVFYADKVILQSENMAKIYKAEFRKAATENGVPAEELTDEKLDAKFLGTGSPKFDKVMQLSDMEHDIPEEWRCIVYREDGSRKKVMLYNTTIAAMLSGGAKMLDKIEWALNVFYENRDKVALLWRPHPLLRNTIESMEGELLTRYDAIVAKYRTDAWGIYDDTPDMDRAIAISDAYYGDCSSVETLYEKVGKPIMIQNVDVMN